MAGAVSIVVASLMLVFIFLISKGVRIISLKVLLFEV